MSVIKSSVVNNKPESIIKSSVVNHKPESIIKSSVVNNNKSHSEFKYVSNTASESIIPSSTVNLPRIETQSKNNVSDENNGLVFSSPNSRNIISNNFNAGNVGNVSKALANKTGEKPIDDLHIILILDESESMTIIRNDIIGSVNTMLREQQSYKKDNTTFTLLKISTTFSIECSKIPLNQAKFLTKENYFPSGKTALYDTIGYAINKYIEDENVCVFIVTDGEENGSRKFNREQINSLVEKKKIDGWKFIYLSVDTITAKQGDRIGIKSSTTHSTTTQNITSDHKNLPNTITNTCSTAIKEIRSRGVMKGYGN